MKLKAACLLAIGVACVASAQQRFESLFGLPVGPGGPGIGPWQVAIWPQHGCKDCKESVPERTVFAKSRDALIAGKLDLSIMSGARFHVLPLRPFSPANEKVVTAEELHDLISGCSVGSQGVLQRAKNGSRGISYGVGLDCPGTDSRRWLSLSFERRMLTHVYYLPGEPIQVLGPEVHGG